MSAADQLASLLTVVVGGAVPIRLRAWDGSESGPDGGPVLVVESTDALRRLLWQPNELGLAQAYAAGEISVDGDLAVGLSRIWLYARAKRVKVSARHRVRALVTAARLGALGLLDIGCGWGSLTLHAARHYGARVVAVTLSAQQHAYVSAMVIARDLGHLVDVRLRDYRDIAHGPYDAVATIEMGEHVGREAYPEFARRLFALTRPGGRVLVQQMSRGQDAPGGGAFIESFIAPDMHMRPVGETVALLERAGLEVRDVHALREHYVLTARAWSQSLDRRWAEAVALVGEPVARIWRLYLAGGALAFAERRMGVDQILAVRPTETGGSGMPAVRKESRC
jgi:cyclopropane fatty-acyl-phospholipid synthase-like methyltransferase